MKRRQNDGRYPDDYAGYQNAGYDDGYDDGSGFQDDPLIYIKKAVTNAQTL